MPKAKTISYYTLVRHSAWCRKEDEQFQQAVEEYHITTKKELMLVAEYGGLIFNIYREASQAEDKINYPEGYSGMIPRAHGIFLDGNIGKELVELDGLSLYIKEKKG